MQNRKKGAENSQKTRHVGGGLGLGLFGENLEEKAMLQSYITTKYQNQQLTRDSLLAPPRRSSILNRNNSMGVSQALQASTNCQLLLG